MPLGHADTRSPAGTQPLGFLQRLAALVDAHPGATALGLYVLAAGLRAWHLSAYHHTLLSHVFLMDEAYYHAEAWNLVRGVPNVSDAWFMTPLYPVFLSLLFRVVGDAPTAVYAVQLALGALAAPLTWILARRVVPPAWALIAGVGMACYAPVVFFESLLLVEWMVLLALLAATCCAVCMRARPAAAAVCGACLGLAVLGRGSNLLLAVPFGIWFARRDGTRAAALCIGTAALVLAPLLVYNARHATQPLLLTANAGFNLYIGNGPEATGIFVVPDRLDLQQDPLALRTVQRQTGRRVTASAASRFWLQTTWKWVREHPGRTAKLAAWKELLFWNRFGFPQVESFETAARDQPLGRFPFWSSHAIFPLGLLGIGIASWRGVRARRRPAAAPRGAAVAAARDRVAAAALVATCTGLYSLSIALFFITDRYRMGAVPGLMVLSTLALAALAEAFAARERRRVVLLVLLGTAAFGFTAPGLLRIDQPRVQRDLHVHEALRFAKAGQFAPAIREYQEALRQAPADPELRDGLGRMYSRAGNDSLAIRTLEGLLRDAPGLARSWYNLGNVYRRAGRNADAVHAYRRAVDLDPRREAAWNNLGETYRVLGDTAAAARAYQRALDIVPAYEQAVNNLAALRAAQGDARAAETGFRAAIAANPRYVPAWTNLAILLADTGRKEAAVAAWGEILRLDPENTRARRALHDLDAAHDAQPR
jgi:tetratricopeptide (TPR) repeat protein